MNNSKRKPLQVSDEFLLKLKDLQKKIRMATGEEKSLRELTEQVAKSDVFKEIENIVSKKGNLNMDIKVRFDRRTFK